MFNDNINPIISILNNFKNYLNTNFIIIDIQYYFFYQILYYINSFTFNLLLKNQKYCTLSNSILLKMSISKLGIF
jgi:hypothetical protein